MKDFLSFLLDVYGAMHRIFEYIFVPWFKYDKNTFISVRNFYASSSVSFFIWLNICYLTDFRYIHSIMNISKLPLEYVVVLTSSVIFIVDYYLFYKSSLSILFQQSFNKCSLYYRTLIYSLALLIMAFPIICIELQ